MLERVWTKGNLPTLFVEIGVASMENSMEVSYKKNEIMPFAAAWMNLEIIILSAVSQTEKDKYNTISLKCGI